MSDSYPLAQQKPASRLAFSNDGRWLAASIWGDSQDTVDVFDTRDRKAASRIESRRCNAAISPALAVSPDGQRVAHGAATLNLWSCKDSSQIVSFKVQKPPSAVSFSPSGHTLSAAGPFDPNVRVFDTASGEQTHRLKNLNSAPIIAVVYLDETTLLACDASLTVTGWDVSKEKVIRRTAPPTPTPLSPASAETQVAVFADSGKYIAATPPEAVGGTLVWDADNGNLIGETDRLADNLALSGDGRWLAIAVTNVNSTVLKVVDFVEQKVVLEMKKPFAIDDQDNRFGALCFSANSSHLAYSEMGAIRFLALPPEAT